MKPLQQLAALTVCLHSTFLAGCFGHVTYIALDGWDLAPAELDALSAEINRRVEPLGMRRDPELDYARKISRGPEYEFLVVDRWVSAGGDGTRAMRVFVTKDKEDGSVSVVVRDVLWPRPTETKRDLEQAVKGAISEVLPQQELEVRSEVHGPIIPP